MTLLHSSPFFTICGISPTILSAEPIRSEAFYKAIYRVAGNYNVLILMRQVNDIQFRLGNI
jgi:hypothetical protein